MNQFEMKEMEVDNAAERVSKYYDQKEIMENPQIEQILGIVRQFIRDNDLVLYGGTAINAQLPPEAQFYDYSEEIPDYDFYSTDAKEDAKRLADILFAAGYLDSSARSGVHEGTYKVSADFRQIADITQMAPEVIEQIDAVRLSDGMLYSGPMWLRVDMYKQLAESQGQQSRWPKVWKRLQLLNKYQPLGNAAQCEEAKQLQKCDLSSLPLDRILPLIIRHVISYQRVLVGSLSQSIYRELDNVLKSRFSLAEVLKQFRCIEGSNSLIDVLSLDPAEDMFVLQRAMRTAFPSWVVDVRRLKDSPELYDERHQLLLNGIPLIESMKPHQCYGYVQYQNLRMGTLDTILTLLWAKLFVDAKEQSIATKAKYLCALEYLMDLVERRGNMQGEGLFARFPIQCYGKQLKLSDVFRERWQNRINRLVAKKKGIYLENPILNYRPYDQQLIARGIIDPFEKAKRVFRRANQSFSEMNEYRHNHHLPDDCYLKLCEGAHKIKSKCVFAKQKWVAGWSPDEFSHCIDDVDTMVGQFDNYLMSSAHYYN